MYKGFEFLDLSEVSEHEQIHLNSILYGGGDCLFQMPGNPPLQAPWHVSGIPPPASGQYTEEVMNGMSDSGTEDIVEDGALYSASPMMQPPAPATVPPVYSLMHPQANVYVNNVTANINLPNFHPSMTTYSGYQNSEPSANLDVRSTNNVRRARSTKPTSKRLDGQVPHSPPGNYQYPPNATPYIPAQVSPQYPFYQSPAGIPPSQAMASNPIYLPHQYTPHVVLGFPPATVYSPPAHAAPHPPIEDQEVKEPVPYNQMPEQHQQQLPLAQPLQQPLQQPQQPQQQQQHLQQQHVTIHPPTQTPPIVNETSYQQNDEEITVVNTVIVENSKLNQSVVQQQLSEAIEEEPKKEIESSPTSSPPQKQPLQHQHSHKHPLLVESTPLVDPSTPGAKSWASLFNQSSGHDAKPLARINPTVQHDTSVVLQHSHSHSPAALGQHASVMNMNQINSTPQNSTVPLQKRIPRSPSLPAPCLADDPNLFRLGEFLVQYQLDHKPAVLQPRGLTNRSNYCYINATLQALLACPPLYNVLKTLPLPKKSNSSHSKSRTPIIDSMVQFMNEFEEMSMSLLKCRREKAQARKDEQNPGGSIEIVPGPAFEPTYVYKMLNVIRNDTAFPVEGRQEDAEEFLSCLLNGLNDEMLELQKLANNNLSNGEATTNGDTYHDIESDSEWKEVTNGRNRQAVTRRTEVTRTPLSQIFQGQLRSRVLRVGNESTDNVQPFFTLPLDIEKSQSVKEALDKIVTKDVLEGVTCTKTNQEIEAWQQVSLEQLPLVLLLHLKCFDYKLQTCSKIIKSVEFTIDLKIEPKLMSTSVKNKNKKNPGGGNTGKERQYKLFAVVYHDGKEATKGHYITDVFHVGYSTWVRYDDATVKAVSEAQVLRPKSPRVPYLLYYRRQDTINVPQAARSQRTGTSDS